MSQFGLTQLTYTARGGNVWESVTKMLAEEECNTWLSTKMTKRTHQSDSLDCVKQI